MAKCQIVGVIKDGSEDPTAGVYVTAVCYDSPAIIQGTSTGLSPTPITEVTSSTGKFILELIRNVKYTVRIPEMGFVKTVTVPNSAGPVDLWALTDVFVSGDVTPADSGEDNW